jgi:hypothetical protein
MRLVCTKDFCLHQVSDDVLLLHNLDVDLLHVDLLIELWRKLCLLQELLVDRLCHVAQHNATDGLG